MTWLTGRTQTENKKNATAPVELKRGSATAYTQPANAVERLAKRIRFEQVLVTWQDSEVVWSQLAAMSLATTGVAAVRTCATTSRMRAKISTSYRRG